MISLILMELHAVYKNMSIVKAIIIPAYTHNGFYVYLIHNRFDPPLSAVKSRRLVGIL